MDFTLTTDIDAEFLDWDDDENGGDQENDHHYPGNDLDCECNEREFKASGAVDREDCTLRNEPRSSINHPPSFESSPQEYFTASTFIEQSSLKRQHSSSVLNDNGTANDDSRMEQTDGLEPLYPPNFFFSGMVPWDPSQAVNNPNIAKTATQDVALSNSIGQPRFPSYNSNLDSKIPARSSSALEQQPSQQIQWQAAQASSQNNSRRINAQPNHQNALNLAAVAASAAANVGVQRAAYDEHSIQDTRRTITDSSINTGSSSSSHPSSFSSDSQRNVARISGSRDTRSQNPNNANDPSEIPPFYLFDAPCELRTNFLQAQRQHAIATGINDSNSVHYGMAVNGFHPQVNAQANPVAPDSSGPAVLPNGKHVELLDGRHKNKRKTIERNEREQQRAQKISDLIEKLRDTMEQGGWKVEMKSKYQILST